MIPNLVQLTRVELQSQWKTRPISTSSEVDQEEANNNGHKPISPEGAIRNGRDSLHQTFHFVRVSEIRKTLKDKHQTQYGEEILHHYSRLTLRLSGTILGACLRADTHRQEA